MTVIAINIRQRKYYTSLPKVDKVLDTITEVKQVLPEEKVEVN